MKKLAVLALGLLALGGSVLLRPEPRRFSTAPVPPIVVPRAEAVERPSLPEPAPPPTADRTHEVLPRILEDYARAAAEPGASGQFRFEADVKLHRRELRLFARAHPEAAALRAAVLARDRAAEFYLRWGAIELLGILALDGRKDAESELVGLARGSEESLAMFALKLLDEADVEGAHRALFRDLALTYAEAARALAYRPDPAAEERLQELARISDSGRFLSEHLRGRLKRLSSAQGLSGLIQEIENPSKGYLDAVWAIRAARANGVSGLLPALRKRLDATARTMNVEDAADWARSLQRPLRDDRAYDEALVAYHRLGGALTPLEAERLRFFGYAGDPEAGLDALTK